MADVKSFAIGSTAELEADTLDEAPASYKGCDAIEEAIAPNAEIVARLKPVYNFKATS